MTPITLMGEAEDHVARRMSILVGLGFIAFSVISLEFALDQREKMPAWWVYLSLTTTFLCGVFHIAAAWVRCVVIVRYTALTYAVVHFLMSTFYLVWIDPDPALNRDVPWLNLFMALVTVSLAVHFRKTVVAAHLAAGIVFFEFPISMHDGAGVSLTNVIQVCWAIAVSFLFVFLCYRLVDSARAADHYRARQSESLRQVQASRAFEAEQSRVNQLTHDWVMSSLLEMGHRGTSPQLQAQATRALQLIEKAPDATEDTALGVDDFSSLLQSSARSLGVCSSYGLSLTTREWSIPSNVAREIISAAINSVRVDEFAQDSSGKMGYYKSVDLELLVDVNSVLMTFTCPRRNMDAGSTRSAKEDLDIRVANVSKSLSGVQGAYITSDQRRNFDTEGSTHIDVVEVGWKK